MRAPFQLFLLCIAPLALVGQEPTEDLANELRRWSAVVEAGTAVSPSVLPDSWIAETANGRHTIPTAPLKAYFRSGSNKERAAVQAWLHLLADTLSSTQAHTPDPTAAAKLDRILNQREFRPTKRPSRQDLWWRRVRDAILRFLDSLFSAAGKHSGGVEVFAWLLLVSGSGLLVYLLVRSWRHEDRTSQLPPTGHLPRRSLNSSTWIAAAHAARSQNDLPRAIQCCYWAGITHLQELGRLPPHFAHTPREHLRLLARGQQPTTALQTLCTHLERCWYARVTPGDEDLVFCFGALKELGCQVD